MYIQSYYLTTWFLLISKNSSRKNSKLQKCWEKQSISIIGLLWTDNVAAHIQCVDGEIEQESERKAQKDLEVVSMCVILAEKNKTPSCGCKKAIHVP